MFKKNIDFNKCFKFVLIGYAIFFLIATILTLIFGVNLSIDFKGGTRLVYSYSGELDTDKVDALTEETLSKKVSVTTSSGLTGDSQKITITLASSEALSNEAQQNLDTILAKQFPNNNIKLAESNSVAGSVAGNFFAKAMVSVLITAVLVILYVGIRFRKIGGVSAAITAFVALIIDILVAFFTCTMFGLEVDMTFLAVILTILGYSLNDTIVIYDRVRENKGIYPNATTAELVNESLNTVKIRTIVTTTTTFLAVVMIIVVAEIFGISSLRSFAIPMAFGLVSGSLSSLFISAPLWVIWKNKQEKKGPKKAKSKKRR
ncbi:MAG: protein translocase subunit SecF [Ruminococcaceae bacterium]|nr:protein translocase subunit SecF [Oscillospiraceae bacterium]